jgi:glycosyltransferase involved in cell wall biosynthesis
MNIALLFGFFPENSYQDILNDSKGGIQNAADALQKSIIDGMSVYYPNELFLINLPYIGSFPKRYSKFFFHSGKIRYKTLNTIEVQGLNASFCNLSGLKFVYRYLSAKKEILKWLKKVSEAEQSVIVVYAAHLPFLKACIDIKEKYYPLLKIILIVPDLPQYMNEELGTVRKIFSRINIYLLNRIYKKIDGYVLLTKYMADILPISSKTVVMEGIFSNIKDNCKYDSNIANLFYCKYILYTGTLAKTYGVMNLVEAFDIINSSFDIKLVICGAGGCESEIIEYTKRNNKIIYLGQLKREETLELQRNAMLLVNPRTPEGEFTKYSFPSKTMEYFASGTPTMLYKLPGIPDEYYKYCFCVDDLGIDILKQKLIEVFEMNPQDLKEMGSKARDFITKEKNPTKQCEKIVNLIKSLH